MIHKVSYQQSIGKIAGIRASFMGTGIIDALKLVNAKGKLVYVEDFEGAI